MIDSGLTLASLAGALAYLGTAVLAVLAGRSSRRRGDPRAWHWLVVAGMFLALAGWRLGLGEIRLQEDVRAWAQARGFYEQRRTFQALLTLTLLAATGITLAVVTTRRISRSTWALGAASGLILFSFVRFVSLHQLDSLLFRTGPLHLNYVIDLGLAVAAAAFSWWEIVAQEVPGAGRHASRRPRS